MIEGTTLTLTGGGTTQLLEISGETEFPVKANLAIQSGAVRLYGAISGGVLITGGDVQFVSHANVPLTSLIVRGGTVDFQWGQTVAGAIVLGVGATVRGAPNITSLPMLTAQGSVALGATLADTQPLLISKTSPRPVIGVFINAPANQTFLINGVKHRVLYNSGDGNDVALLTGDVVGPAASLAFFSKTDHTVDPDVHQEGLSRTTLSIVFTDDSGIVDSQISGNPRLVKVTGPRGYVQYARFESITGTATRKIATFSVTGPLGDWTVADAGAYSLSIAAGALTDAHGAPSDAQTVGTFYVSPTPLFDERYYQQHNPDVVAAIKSGAVTSGWDHFIRFGQTGNRKPFALYDEATYLRLNPDVAAAVKAGRVKSGWQHLLRFGLAENRPVTPFFDSAYYLAQNPDVAAAVHAGTAISAFTHYLASGQYEDRSPSLYFDASYYAAQNPAAAATVASGQYESLFQQFILAGQQTGAPASTLFDESFYLTRYPDVAAAVHAGKFHSGLEHYLLYGRKEGRSGVGTQ
jgi:hypothetical protein